MLTNYLIYLRKSRADNPDMTVDEVLAKHETILQDFARSEFGEEIPERFIFREVVSGETIAARPIMQRLMQLLESSNVKGVLVVDPQRLSRGDLEDCGKIVNVFRYTGTQVLTPQRSYNLADEYDRKFFELELTRGNDYLEYTKKILYRGRTASVKRGNYIGSVAPYGYKKITVGSGKDVQHTLEVVPEEAEALRLMCHLYLDEGMGFQAIAHQLDALGFRPRKAPQWSPAAIKGMIENPVYIGKIRWNWRKSEKKMVNGEIILSRPKNKDQRDYIYVDGLHDPIISEDVHRAILAKRGTNPCVRKGTELKNPFAGLLCCGRCGHAMSLKRSTYKRQPGRMTESFLCDNQSNCHTKSVLYTALYDRVVQTLEASISDFEILLKNDDNGFQRSNLAIIQTLESEIEKLHAKDMRQKDAFDDGIYSKDEYLSRNAKVQEQLEKAHQALQEARLATSPIVDYREKIARFTDCLAALRDPDVPAAEKNKFLKTCIKKITYHNHMESKAGIGRYVENVFDLDIELL